MSCTSGADAEMATSDPCCVIHPCRTTPGPRISNRISEPPSARRASRNGCCERCWIAAGREAREIGSSRWHAGGWSHGDRRARRSSCRRAAVARARASSATDRARRAADRLARLTGSHAGSVHACSAGDSCRAAADGATRPARSRSAGSRPRRRRAPRTRSRSYSCRSPDPPRPRPPGRLVESRPPPRPPPARPRLNLPGPTPARDCAPRHGPPAGAGPIRDARCAIVAGAGLL